MKLALSKVMNETYLAINYDSQCVYFRNYMKRIVFISSYLDLPADIVKQLPSIHLPERKQKVIRSGRGSKIRYYRQGQHN